MIRKISDAIDGLIDRINIFFVVASWLREVLR
jgi:hypothetical protein